MKLSSKVSLCCFFIVTLLLAACGTVNDTSKAKGTLSIETKPANATVKVVSVGKPVKALTPTSNDKTLGKSTFTASAGRYTITISAKGYTTQTITKDISSAKEESLKVSLKRETAKMSGLMTASQEGFWLDVYPNGLGPYPKNEAGLDSNVGIIKSDVGDVNCGPSCYSYYAPNTVVTLTATPAEGYEFESWGRACADASGNTCKLTVKSYTEVDANFKKKEAASSKYTLRVRQNGDKNGIFMASGKVMSSPEGISCGAACEGSFDAGTVVTLTATATKGGANNSEFVGWGGACAGAIGNECKVTMNEAKTVEANFKLVPEKYDLRVFRKGQGWGKITSTPTGISCGAACLASFTKDSTVTLKATTRSSEFTVSTFEGWGGACAGTQGDTCTVTMNEAKTVDATFSRKEKPIHKLNIGFSGNGHGNVIDIDDVLNPIVDCGTENNKSCSVDFPEGKTVRLRALALSNSANTLSVFEGWSGACASAGKNEFCTVTMDETKTAVAIFKEVPRTKQTVLVRKQGNGRGDVSSNPVGISCGSACLGSFEIGAQVTLTATPYQGPASSQHSSFGGWGGACAGQSGNTCTITVKPQAQANYVEASFNKQ